MAPLQNQFQKHFVEVAGKTSDIEKQLGKISQKVTAAEAKAATQSGDVYASQARKNELQAVKKEYADKQAELAKAKQEEADAHKMLQKAQADGTANAPGAVWNPRIQRLLDLPIVKQGINQGIKLEKQDAAAEFRPFSLHEYAIVGENAAGEPIVGTVPNMKLLASAKEGLDSILSQPSMRDELTGRLTKEGVSVDKVRRALLEQLKTENPSYAKALDSWAGYSSSIRSVDYGRKALGYKPEDIAEELAGMSPAEKEFAKVGMADTIREKIMRTGIGGDEAKAVMNNEWTKAQMRPFFNSDKEFNSFIKSVTDERTMFNTKAKLVGNSATAERVAEDESNTAANLGIGINIVKGNFNQALKGIIQSAQDAKWKNEKLNEAAAKILFDPHITLDKLKPPPSVIQKPVSAYAPVLGTSAAEQILTPEQ